MEGERDWGNKQMEGERKREVERMIDRKVVERDREVGERDD